jgi:peptidoglycan hydrolase-like protein with peptidoglycan-binding domain
MPRSGSVMKPTGLLRLTGLVAGLAVLPLLSACGGEEGDSSVKVAQARVTAKEHALDEAKADLKEKSAAFCDASASYITALDRYGDVLAGTAVTVGDVTQAGADLADPRRDVVAGAEAATSAQQAVVDAQQELAEAEAALTAATSSGSAAPSSPASVNSPAPLAPTATVNRVEQAEAEFTAVQKGISADTPLAQAAQQFNAAAVALEMSWLRLFADAGCLTNDQQKQAEAAVREYTTTVQSALREAGYYEGTVDGVYGPATVDAVEAVQKAHGLPTTGTVDKATAAALQGDLAAKGGAAAQKVTASTAAVQQTLKLAGFWDGPVDGTWTPELTDAVEKFQKELGVPPTGEVDAATVAALEKALAAAAAPPSPSPSASPSSPPQGGSGSASASPSPS